MALLKENLLETVLVSEGCFMSAARLRLRLSTFRLQNVQQKHNLLLNRQISIH